MNEGDDLEALCRAAGRKAADLAPGAAPARNDADAASRRRRWTAVAGVAAGLATAAVVAAQYAGDPPSPAASPSSAAVTRARPLRSVQACDGTACPRAATPLPNTPEAVVRAITAPQAGRPVDPPTDDAPPREPATQAEKELRESQPDGSC